MKYTILICIVAFVACQPNVKNDDSVNQSDSLAGEVVVTLQADSSSFTSSSFPLEDNSGFGFTIIKNGKPVIVQKNIPSVQGNIPFVSDEDALATANLMIAKMKSGIFPPSIKPEELDSMGVVY